MEVTIVTSKHHILKLACLCAIIVVFVFGSCKEDSGGGSSPGEQLVITKFTILDRDGVIADNTIDLALPEGTVLTELTPTITHTGASVDPASGVPQDFTNPVPYTVTAEDSSTRVYTVTVTVSEDVPALKAAAWLTVPSGSVVYKGADPSSPGNDKTLTFNSDNTFEMYWNPNDLGWTTSTGTWSCDSNHRLTLNHTGVIMGTAEMICTEIYDYAFTYNDGEKLTMAAYKQTSTSPHGGEVGSTVIGTYNSHTNVNVRIIFGENVIEIPMDVVGTLNITGPSENTFPWTTTTTATDVDPVTANGSLAIPADVWLYKIGSNYYKDVDLTYTLTKQ